jgi:hypothetical protein
LSADEDEDEILQANGITELEKQLAHFRVLLEKKWGNELDNSCTYIYPDGTLLPLTPHMIKEWARAIVSSSLIYFLL